MKVLCGVACFFLLGVLDVLFNFETSSSTSVNQYLDQSIPCMNYSNWTLPGLKKNVLNQATNNLIIDQETYVLLTGKKKDSCKISDIALQVAKSVKKSMESIILIVTGTDLYPSFTASMRENRDQIESQADSSFLMAINSNSNIQVGIVPSETSPASQSSSFTPNISQSSLTYISPQSSSFTSNNSPTSSSFKLGNPVQIPQTNEGVPSENTQSLQKPPPKFQVQSLRTNENVSTDDTWQEKSLPLPDPDKFNQVMVEFSLLCLKPSVPSGQTYFNRNQARSQINAGSHDGPRNLKRRRRQTSGHIQENGQS